MPNISLQTAATLTEWSLSTLRRRIADAMHLLGTCYLKGNGLAKDHNLAIMWIAKAASLGHPIAIAQIQSIRPA